MPHREECERLRLPRSSKWAGLWAGSGHCTARGGSNSWLVQPGFPCALVLFQLLLLWQPIPLLSS